jgi:hypothetical protein
MNRWIDLVLASTIAILMIMFGTFANQTIVYFLYGTLLMDFALELLPYLKDRTKRDRNGNFRRRKDDI